MKILVLGADGYIGKPLSASLERDGHDVYRLDTLIRRMRAKSLTPLSDVNFVGKYFPWNVNDIHLCKGKYDAIIHLAQQPSAPWSMQDKWHCEETQVRNIAGNLAVLWFMKEYCPDAHLIKIGSMGEYGTPNCEIPEGFIESGKYAGMAFPKKPGSFYHLSKVFDSMNIEFACRIWGLRSTDIMQGVVFGHNYWDDDPTRLDYDQYFGTVINRFCAQAVAGIPLTVYGEGTQIRSFLPLQDSIECLTLALENPPMQGEYRVFNQYAEYLSINELAHAVASVSEEAGIPATIEHLPNIRKEAQRHSYLPTNGKLRALGYKPDWDLREEIGRLIYVFKRYEENIDKSVIKPTLRWGHGNIND